MTAKEYLSQLYVLEAKYQTKLEQVNDLRLLATSTGAIRYDKEQVQTSPKNDQMINALIKITEAENDAMRYAVEIADKKQQIIEQIINLDDEKYMRILCLRYVHHMKLEKIAQRMHFDYDWTRKLHGKALEAFEQTYPHIKEI